MSANQLDPHYGWSTWVEETQGSQPLILLAGIPGSGKSTWARQFVRAHPGYQIVSTDQIRADIYGDEAIQGNWSEIWRQLLYRWQWALQLMHQGQLKGVIYDATNCRRRSRRQALATIQALGYGPVVGLWFDVALEVALTRNQLRSRQVPAAIIETMFRQLQNAPPTTTEGFDQVIRIAADSRAMEPGWGAGPVV